MEYSPVKQKLPPWIPIGLAILALGLAGLAYTQYDAKSTLEQRVADLESKASGGCSEA